MSKLEKQYCTELYPTADEENFGRAGDFCVYEAEPVDRLRAEALRLARVVVSGDWRAQCAAIEAAQRFIEEYES